MIWGVQATGGEEEDRGSGEEGAEKTAAGGEGGKTRGREKKRETEA